MPAKPEVTFTLRLGKTLHRKVTELAAAEHRSLNSQVMLILEEKISQTAKAPKP